MIPEILCMHTYISVIWRNFKFRNSEEMERRGAEMRKTENCREKNFCKAFLVRYYTILFTHRKCPTFFQRIRQKHSNLAFPSLQTLRR